MSQTDTEETATEPVRLRPSTKAALAERGRVGDTYDDVVRRLLENESGK